MSSCCQGEMCPRVYAEEERKKCGIMLLYIGGDFLEKCFLNYSEH